MVPLRDTEVTMKDIGKIDPYQTLIFGWVMKSHHCITQNMQWYWHANKPHERLIFIHLANF